MVLVLQQNKKN